MGGGIGGGDTDAKANATDDSTAKAEEKIKEEWLRAYLGALKNNTGDAAAGEKKQSEQKQSESDAPAVAEMVTDDLVALAMADGGDEVWEDVEEEWEDA